jgi:hypothetical protein
MAFGETDTRAASLVDIPLVKRVTEKGTVLDSELYYTRDGDGPHSTTLFSSLFMRQRGLHTLISRAGDERVVGQFRLKPNSHHAHMVYLAPRLDEDMDDTLWLHCLDAIAYEAGRRGAHTLIAEVDENSRLFRTLRTSSFSIYARQEIWMRMPGEYPAYIEPVELTEANEADAHEIGLLYCNIVPRLIQHIAGLPGGQGLVYRPNDRVEGYIAVAEGKSGIYMMPHLHPDVFSEASSILAAAMSYNPRARKVPVYMCVRRYQDWLEEALTELGFDIYARQAFMVRHIAAGVRHAAFEPLTKKLEGIPVRPPTSSRSERMIETSQQK